MKRIAIAAALGFAAMCVSASDKPECTAPNGETGKLGDMVRHDDGSKYVCLCDYDPGSDGKGFWACGWQLFEKAPGSQ